MADLKKAVAYCRTSSATNVGADKDSDKRQLVAINAYAKSAGYAIVETFHDAAVSGADPIDARPEFTRMLERLLNNGAKTIIVESADRFARDLLVQLTGHKKLADLGLTLIAASAPSHFTEDTPTARLVRQMMGAVHEFDKATLVAKLRGSRERKRKVTGKCEGRKNHMEMRPDVVALAKALRRKRPSGAPMSLREISAALAAQGHVNAAGNPFNPKSVQSMLTGPRRA
jgi:DNA invertase Pin-like site-specific DNA recombinase